MKIIVICDRTPFILLLVRLNENLARKGRRMLGKGREIDLTKGLSN